MPATLNAWRRLAVLLASAGALAACCTPVAAPGTVQPGSGSCGAYFAPSNSASLRGAENR